MEEPYVLEMRNISKAFPGVQALNDVTFRLRPGTVHALMGENGAGKSTLMKCLFGIYKPDEGEIVLNGQSVVIQNSRDALNHGISMIHQELYPIPFRNVMENIWLGRFPMFGFWPLKFVSERQMEEDTLRLFRELDIDIDPRATAARYPSPRFNRLRL